MKLSFLFVCVFFSYFSDAQNKIGVFQGQSDVGNVKTKGLGNYDSLNQKYMIGSTGENMWFGKDDFHFVWKKLKGNFILNARMQFNGKGKNPHRKIGWMARSGLETNSAYADAIVHGDGTSALQYRTATGDSTLEIKSDIAGPDVLQLERKGNVYIVSVAKHGDTLKEAGRITLDLGKELYIGLFVCAHDADAFEEATFSNVRVTVPAKDTYVAYRDLPGSTLETLDVATGHRKILYSIPDVLEAPNWTKDGALIYNSKGLLHRLPLTGKNPVVINTDFAKRNNNDHLVSADGTQLAISNQGNSDSSSTASFIYTVPIGGGKPKQVTDKGPSYLHGWTPDGKTLAYCAERNGNYDVYSIPVSGGTEQRLTTAEGLDDGPEYSPDGKYIYFNSNRTGQMHVWRMKPDGSEQQQITKDDFNNWFPHLSPDGKWIVFLSFTKEVRSGDHPPCKRVMIRLMPVNGNAPARVLAYVYGGQGTINVPSWSPDGKQIAFVSYSFPESYYAE